MGTTATPGHNKRQGTKGESAQISIWLTNLIDMPQEHTKFNFASEKKKKIIINKIV